MRIPPREIIPGAQDKRCRIVPAVAPNRYVLYAGDEMIKEHWSPQWLSESALASGALEVRWAFDLGRIKTQ